MTLTLRHYQQEAIDAVFDYWGSHAGNPLIDLATGCHIAGTRILMHDGSVKAVELVAANDNVMGPDGNARRVLKLARGYDDLYRITPVKGESFVVNAGHVLSLKTTGEGKVKQRSPRGLRAGTVENVQVRDWLTKGKYWKHTRKLWRTGCDFPFRPEPGVPAWIMGALIGDGCLLYGVSACNPDHEFLDALCDYAAETELNVRVAQRPNNKARDVFFTDPLANRCRPNRLTAMLRENGTHGTGAGDKFIPDEYKLGSRETRLGILAGLLDSDGFLDRAGCVFDYVSKSETLARDVVFVCRSLGLAAYIKPCEKYCQTGGGGTYWRVCISGDVDIIPTKIARKQARPRLQKKNPLVTGFSVEYVGKGEFFGFELDGDHLYLTDDFTVHHNTGKSLVMASLIERLLGGWPHMRVVVAAHVEELISQNYEELLGIWPFAPAGIYAASLGRRDHHAQIMFASIHTVYNKTHQIGHVDVLMVDECHLIPFNDNTKYRKFIAGLREINPDMKIVGLTATDYRLDGGRLTEHDDRIFDEVVYSYGIGAGIADGYLAPLTSKAMDTAFDLTGVGTLGGDYKQNALQAAVDKADVTEAAVAEIVTKGQDRRSWLLFGSGVEHATHIRDAIRQHGIVCEVITGETPKQERRDLIEAFKNYEIRALTNNSVLTTGFNHKGVDLLGFLRPTKSLSLYCQMGGRGTRALYARGMPLNTPDERKAAIAASEKPNCLVLDFAKLAYTHGPIDMVKPKEPGKGAGEAPVKQCPQCDELIHISVMKCHCCGYDFPAHEKDKITATAGSAPIMSTEVDMWRAVTARDFKEHAGRDNGDGARKPDSVKATYMCGMLAVNSWICPGHTGFAKTKADHYWLDHGGKRPFPANAEEFLLRQFELRDTAEIEIEYNGKYPNVRNYRVGEHWADEREPEVPASIAAGWSRDLDDEIPF